MPELDSKSNKGVSFGSNTATADKTTERSDIRSSRNKDDVFSGSSSKENKSSDRDKDSAKDSRASYGYSRSLSFAPADVSSKYILVLADSIQESDSDFFETILDQLNMSIVVICNEATKTMSEKSVAAIAAELELDSDWIDLKWMKLPESSTSTKKKNDKEQSKQLDEISSLVSKFDCVAVLDAHLRWVQSHGEDDDEGSGDEENNNKIERKGDECSSSAPPLSPLRDLACKLAVDTGATDMTDSPFWKIFR